MLRMIVLWCSSLGSVMQEEAPAPGDEGFYESHRYHLHAMGEGGPTELQMLQEFGRFAEMEVGETLELAALRLGLDPERIRLQNPDAEKLEQRVLCLELRHRCLPGETLDDIARAHRTEVGILRALNDLPEPQEPARWSKVLVPAQLSRNSSLVLQLPMPHWNWARDGEAPLVFRSATWTHQVAEGDTWKSLAERAGCSEAVLRRVNAPMPQNLGPGAPAGLNAFAAADAEEDPAPPEPGQTLTLGWKHLVDPERDLEATVLFLEYFLRVDLDQVLEQNGLDRTEWMLAGETVELPFSGWAGFRGIRLHPGGSSFEHPPGLHMKLGFGNHDGATTFDLEVSDQ